MAAALHRYIHLAAADLAGAEEPAATRERLKACFAPGATRRMTQLGLIVGGVLHGWPVDADHALVYATAYSETRALENYLDGFPTPSPLMFQTSIHPSAVQQVLIGRQQALRRFFPLSGAAQIVTQALRTALLEPAHRVHVVAGEERGTWLQAYRQASDRTFAWGLSLSAQPAGACGEIGCMPGVSSTGAAPAPPDLWAVGEAIAARRALAWRGPDQADWRITWW
jgi:hypothetical protein